MIGEELQRLIVERRQAVAQERRQAVAHDRHHQLVARDAAMKDRVAPHVGTERHRHEIGRGAVGGRTFDPLAAARRLSQRFKKPHGLGAATLRVVVNQPRDLVQEAATVRHRIDAERVGERLGAAGHRHVLDGHGGRHQARGKGCDERGEEQTGQPP